jgi:hypothetical protein
MRRPALLAALALVWTLPVCQAQRGGGFHGSVARTGSSRPAMPGGHTAFGRAPTAGSWSGVHPPPPSNWHFGNPHHQVHFHIYTYPWWYGGYYGYPGYYGYSPLFWGGTWDASYDSAAQQDDQRQLMRQIDDLGEEVTRLQQEHDMARLQPPPVPQPHADTAAKATTSDLPTILVYPDKHIEEVKNYAIVGEMLWILADHVKKIPLMDIDLAATSKLNDERGVYFEVPGRIPSQ